MSSAAPGRVEGRDRSEFGVALFLGALGVLVVAVRPLLPPGTLTAHRGLPATVLLRGLLAATFFSTEVYLPLMLHERFGLPLWLAGATLTVAAIAWASASAVQGRLGPRLPHARAVRIGTVLLLVGDGRRLGTADAVRAWQGIVSGFGPDKGIVRNNPAFVEWAHAAGLTVTPYTFRAQDPTDVKAEMAYFLYELGVDGLFTDNPDLFPRR